MPEQAKNCNAMNRTLVTSCIVSALILYGCNGGVVLPEKDWQNDPFTGSLHSNVKSITTCTVIDSVPDWDEKSVALYDKQGLCVETRNYSKLYDTLYQKSLYTYNDEKLIAEIYETGFKGQFLSRSTFTYDYEKRQIQMDFVYTDEGANLVRNYSYDEHGHLTSYNVIYPQCEKPTQACTTVNKYDSEGRKISSTTIQEKMGEKKTYTTTYLYNENGDVAEYKSVCNDNGNVLRHRRFTYRYDEHGNWTEQRAEHIDGILPMGNTITVREIEYYD